MAGKEADKQGGVLLLFGAIQKTKKGEKALKRSFKRRGPPRKL